MNWNTKVAESRSRLDDLLGSNWFAMTINVRSWELQIEVLVEWDVLADVLVEWGN